MTKKIFRSIITIVSMTLFLSMLIVMFVLYGYFMDVEKRWLKTDLYLIEGSVQDNGIQYLEGRKFGDLRITLIDSDGVVIYDSDADSNSMDNHLDREEVAEALISGYGESSRYSSTLMSTSLYCAKLLDDGSILRVSVSVVSVFAIFLRAVVPVIAIFIIVVLLSVVISKRIAGKIVEPINYINLDKPLENENAYEELAPLLGKINKQRKDLKKSGKELKQKENEFRQIINYMDEGMVLLNDKAEIISINKAACRFFEINEEFVGNEFLKVDRSHKMTNAISEALKGRYSEFFVPKNGGEYRININKIEYEERILGAVILVFDVSEQAFFRRTRQEFTANVSHELKTPLQSIIGSAELIENNLVKQEDINAFAGRILNEAKRMVTLVDDTIRLSQLDEKLEIPMENIDLYEIAKEAVGNLESFAKDKNVDLRLEGVASQFFAVKKYVYEIIYNLCENAIRYNVNNGSVKITISRNKIIVADTGIGIPEEHQNRVFERFYRVDKSHSRATGGTGLGLSIVKNAVQYMGGNIKMTSEIGKGTVIEIQLFPLT